MIFCSCGKSFRSLIALNEHAEKSGGLLHGDQLPEIKLATCANHGIQDCPHCGAYAVMPTATPEQRAEASGKLAAGAIDYTHGRITIGELVRIAKGIPR